MSKTERPMPPTVDADGIPEELRLLKRWAGDSISGPVTSTGKPAYACDSQNWMTFEEAKAACPDKEGGRPAFVATAGDPYVVIDFHKSIDLATGMPYPKAAPDIRGLASYSEFIEGRHGVRVVLKGRLPVGTSGIVNGSIEVYDRLQFVALTGDRLPDTPAAVEYRQEPLLTLWRRLFPGKCEVAGERDLTDEQIITKAAGASKKFRRLWAGDDSGFHFDSHAELALLRFLAFWTQRDPVRMSALFVKSALCDQKRWKKGKYREPTLCRALEGGVRRRKATNAVVIASASDEGTALALTLASRVKDIRGEEWKWPFDLAQALNHLGGDPRRFRVAVDAFCSAQGVEADEFWYAFLDCWGKVEQSLERCIFKRAAALADAEPVEVSRSIGPEYVKAVSLAYYLAKLSKGGVFFLSGEKLGEFIGMSQRTGSSILSLLQRNGVLECVDASYQFKGKERKSKTYRFISTSIPSPPVLPCLPTLQE